MAADLPHENALSDGVTREHCDALISPAGRPTWSGLLRFSLITIPVKAYPANRAARTCHFHQLHANCGQRIRHEKRCPVHGSVDPAAIVRGFPCAPDQHVLVEDEELERLRPSREKALLLEQFVTLQEIDPIFFAGRSLYLLPDGLAARQPCQLLSVALGQSGKAALGRVVLSGVRQLVLVRVVGRQLVLDVLHYPMQVRSAPPCAFPVGESTSIPSVELSLAGQLIQAASAPLDWARFPDTTAEELARLIKAKIAKRPPTATEEPVAMGTMLEALKRSLAAAQAMPSQNSGRLPG